MVTVANPDKLAELRQREAGYAALYGLNYATFAQCTATDEKKPSPNASASATAAEEVL